MSKKKTPAQRTPVQRVLRSLYIILVALSLVVVASFVALKLYAPPPDVPDQVEFPLTTDGLPEQSPNAVNTADVVDIDKPDTLTLNRRKGVYTCLLVGNADMGGTDTIMLGMFDTEGRTASLISIPRDTAVYVNGQARKINTLYSLGGMDLLTDTVSSTLGIPVDFYVMVDTYAFKAIVDRIGGVWFDVPPGMDYDDPYQDLHIHVPAGYQLLNGTQALGVMRCRSAYVSQDIGRIQTQRRFLAALAKQTITLSNIDKVTDLMNIFFTYVDTDMSLNDMVYFATQAVGMDLDNDLASATLSDLWVSPYIVLDDQAVLKLVNSLGVYEEEIPVEVLNIYHP